jgi:hypothetical protein
MPPGEGGTDCLLGDWEAVFSVGLITKREKDADAEIFGNPNLMYKVYEPYTRNLYTNEPEMPLWAWKANQKPGVEVSTAWEDVLKLPWLPVTQLPMSTWKRFYDAAYQKLPGRGALKVEKNWKGTGLEVVHPLPTNMFKNKVLMNESVKSECAALFTPSLAEKELARATSQKVLSFDKDEWQYMADLPEAFRAKMRRDRQPAADPDEDEGEDLSDLL